MVGAYVTVVTKHVINTSQEDKGNKALAIYFIAGILSMLAHLLYFKAEKPSVCFLCKQHSCVCID